MYSGVQAVMSNLSQINLFPDGLLPVAVILNPALVPSDIDIVEADIANNLTSRGCAVRFFRTVTTCPVSDFAYEAVRSGAKLVIAAGGDGTIMEVVNALVGTGIPVGIIPLGTGNLLATNLGLPYTIDEALDVAVTGVDRPIDLVKINNGDHYFAIMGGIGFDAKIMEDTDRPTKQRIGRLAYVWTALKNLQGQLFEAEIAIDNTSAISVQAKSLLIANMGKLDANINAFPEAVPDNGLMQLGILTASNVTDFARLFANALVVGAPQEDPSFAVYNCKKLEIQLKSPQPFEYDGETAGEISHLIAEVVPHAICIRSPRNG
jgi:YegS/Rv2252/BmrU family lipid kinase